MVTISVLSRDLVKCEHLRNEFIKYIQQQLLKNGLVSLTFCYSTNIPISPPASSYTIVNKDLVIITNKAPQTMHFN